MSIEIVEVGIQGPTGPHGTIIQVGEGPPTDDIGTNGDIYGDSIARTLTGPKANGTWVGASTISIVGPVDETTAAALAVEVDRATAAEDSTAADLLSEAARAVVAEDSKVAKANNGSDFTSAATTRSNLGVDAVIASARPLLTDVTLATQQARVDAFLAKTKDMDRFGLAKQKLMHALAGRSSARKNIYIIGDSIGDDWYASTSANGYLSQFMQEVYRGFGQEYPLGGGYVPASSSSACGYTGRMWTPVANGSQGQTGTTPAWTDISSRGLGYGVAQFQYNGGTNNLYQSPAFVSDRPGLAYTEGALIGNATATLKRASDDATIATLTVPTSTSLGSRSTRLLDGGAQTRDSYYWLVRANNVFHTIIDGAVPFLGNYASGIMFWRACHFGYKWDQFMADGASSGWVTAFDTTAGSNVGSGLPACVIVELGTNNDRAGESIATQLTKINTLITYINDKVDALTGNTTSRPTIILLPAWNTTTTPGEVPNSTYAAWQSWASHTEQVIVLDQTSDWGYTGTGGSGDPFGFTADNVHPNDTGGKAFGPKLGRAFLNLCGVSNSPDGAINAATPRSLGTGSTQAAAGDHTHASLYQPLDADLTLLAAVSPTTKGDVFVFNGTAWTRLPVGSDGKSLTALATASAGVSWEFNFITDRASLPSAALAQSMPRSMPLSGQNIMLNGTALMQLTGFNAGQSVAGVIFTAGGTGLTQGATSNHLWAALCNSSGIVRAVTTDDTNPTWALNTEHAFTFASAYVIPTGGQYYLVVNFTGTGAGAAFPTLLGTTQSLTTGNSKSPILCAAGPAAQTTPPAIGATLTVGAAKAGVAYAYAT